MRTKLLLESIDSWLLAQPRLVNARKRCLLPVVRERQHLADALARCMGQLGLERRAKDVPDLHDYLRQRSWRRRRRPRRTAGSRHRRRPRRSGSVGAMPGIVEGGCTPPHLPTPWRRVLVALAVVLGLAAGLALVFVR